ncbi:MAG: DUF1573 domain-containing protein [Phycisphaerales bacterium]
MFTASCLLLSALLGGLPAGAPPANAGATAAPAPPAPPAAPAPSATPAAPAATRPLRFDPPLLELGTMVAGETSHGYVTITNTGDRPVTITRVVPGCGCTKTSPAPTAPLPPGGSARIEVSLDAGERAGAELRRNVFFHVDGAEPYTYVLHGSVGTFVTMTPAVADASAAGADGTLAVTLESVAGEPFEVRAAEPAGPVRLPAGRALRHQVVLDVAAWKAAGSPARIVLHTTHPSAAKVFLFVKAAPTVALVRLPAAEAADPAASSAAARAQDEAILAIDEALRTGVGTSGFSLRLHRETGALFIHGSAEQVAAAKAAAR